MARIDNFVFRVNAEERRLIAALAQRLRRTESDAVRFVICETMQALEAEVTPSEAGAAEASEAADVAQQAEGASNDR